MQYFRIRERFSMTSLLWDTSFANDEAPHLLPKKGMVRIPATRLPGQKGIFALP
jgi:hypothetical protein